MNISAGPSLQRTHVAKLPEAVFLLRLQCLVVLGVLVFGYSALSNYEQQRLSDVLFSGSMRWVTIVVLSSTLILGLFFTQAHRLFQQLAIVYVLCFAVGSLLVMANTNEIWGRAHGLQVEVWVTGCLGIAVVNVGFAYYLMWGAKENQFFASSKMTEVAAYNASIAPMSVVLARIFAFCSFIVALPFLMYVLPRGGSMFSLPDWIGISLSLAVFVGLIVMMFYTRQGDRFGRWVSWAILIGLLIDTVPVLETRQSKINLWLDQALIAYCLVVSIGLLFCGKWFDHKGDTTD